VYIHIYYAYVYIYEKSIYYKIPIGRLSHFILNIVYQWLCFCGVQWAKFQTWWKLIMNVVEKQHETYCFTVFHQLPSKTIFASLTLTMVISGLFRRDFQRLSAFIPTL